MRALRGIAVAGVAVATLAAGIGAASADPSVQPKTTDIVAVGSDTITPLFGKWSTDYNATSPTNKLYSWDATGSTTIQTKGTSTTDPNCNITRPNGSGAGITQLNQKLKTHDGNYCVDIARSSRALKSSDGTGLAAVALGRDVITASTIKGSADAVTNFTPAELTAIFACDATKLPSGDTTHTGPVLWSDLKLEGGTSTKAIVPVLPQASSGTRSTWLSDLGETWTTAPSCIVNGASSVDGSAIEENEGTNSEFTSANSKVADVLFPYSAGAYLGETVYKTNPQSPGNLGLDKIDSKSALNSAGTGLNLSFDAAFIRTLYAVVLSTGASPYIPTYLQPLLGTGSTTSPGWICKGSSTTVGTGPYDLAQQGFAPAPVCGLVTHQ